MSDFSKRHDEWLNRGNPADYDYSQHEESLVEDLASDIQDILKRYSVAGLDEEIINQIIKEQL